MPTTTPPAEPRPAQQSGSEELVREQVGGTEVRCYATRPPSLVGLLELALAAHAEAVLLVDPAAGRTVTYAGFAALVEGAAAVLRGRGLVAGDRVALLADNGLEAAVAIWACARAGLIHVGLPSGAPPARLRELVELVSPRLLLAQPHLHDAGQQAVLPTRAAGNGVHPTAIADAAEVLLADERPWRHGAGLPDEDATYMLIPTSGTTGRPKAVRVTGRMAGHAAVFYRAALGLAPSDRTAIHLPFAWVSGSITQLAPVMLSGGSAVTMAGFSAGELAAVVREHRVTWLDVVPSIWELLLRSPAFGPAAFGTVRLAVFGGAPAPPGTLDRVRARLPQLRLVDVYALSETCAPVTALPDVEAHRRQGTVGRPAPYADVRVVDGRGEVLPRGEVGELEVRSPTVTPGYWGSDELRRTADGWLRTGDLASLDDEGYLTIGGRGVDMIVRGGVNVSPAEVERALLASEVLADAAAVGVPSAIAGENVAAGVVALPGAAVEVAALQRLVRERLGPHAVPRPLRVLSELPRNSNGKVDRRVLRELLARPVGES